MNRYIVLGITHYGRITRLANRRGTTHHETVEQALKKGTVLAGDYDQILLISIGEDHSQVGEALNVWTHTVQEVPQPRWELVKV